MTTRAEKGLAFAERGGPLHREAVWQPTFFVRLGKGGRGSLVSGRATMPAHVSVDLPEVKGRIKGTRPESAMDEHKKMRAEIGGGGADSDSDDGAEIPAMDSKAETKKRRGSLIRQRMVGDARITDFFILPSGPISSLRCSKVCRHTAISSNWFSKEMRTAPKMVLLLNLTSACRCQHFLRRAEGGDGRRAGHPQELAGSARL